MHRFDLFGAKPTVTLNGRSKDYSVCGLTLTCSCAILFILIAVFFSKEMIERENPSVVASTLYGGTSMEVHRFTADRFRLGVSYPANQTAYIDDTIYKVEAYHFDNKTKDVPIKLVPCPTSLLADDKFPGMMWCIDPSPENVELLQTRDSTMNTFYFKLKPCTNTSSITCKSPEEIEKTIRMSYFTMIFKEVTVDVYNYTTPLAREDRHYAMSLLGQNTTKTNSIYMKKIEIETDYGFFFEDKKTVTDVSIDFITRDLSPAEMYDNAFAIIYIFGGGYIDRFQRTYVKLQDVMANVSGFMNTVLLVVGTIVYHYTKFRMYEKVSSRGFCLEQKDPKISEKLRKLLRSKISKRRKARSELVIESRKASTDSHKPDKPTYFTLGSSLDCQPKSRFTQKQIELPIMMTAEEEPKTPPSSIRSKFKRIEIKDDLTPFEFQTPRTDQEGKLSPEGQAPKGPFRSSPGFEVLESEENFFPQEADCENIKIEFKDSIEDPEKENEDYSGEALNDFVVPSGEQITVRCWEWWLSCFKAMDRVNAVKKASRKVHEYLDISRMLARFIKLERVIDLLLSKEQKAIFDNLPPPYITEEVNYTPQERRRLLNEGIKNLLEKEEWDMIDERLLELYEKTL